MQSTAVESPAPTDPVTTEPVVTEEELERRARRRDLLTTWFWRVLGYVTVLGVWEYASGRWVREQALPAPSKVVSTFGEIWREDDVPAVFQQTLGRIAVGFTLSFLIGVAVGICMQNRWLEGFFRDAVLIGLTTPGLVWALITAIIFGNRTAGPLIAVILTTFALVTVNVHEGIKALPKDLIDMSRAFGVGVVRRNREIVIPHLGPYLFTGVRFGFSIAWKIVVLTEVFASSTGIGFELRVAHQLGQLDVFLTWILAFFVLALFLEKVVLEQIERRFFRWRRQLVT